MKLLCNRLMRSISFSWEMAKLNLHNLPRHLIDGINLRDILTFSSAAYLRNNFHRKLFYWEGLG